MFGLRLQSVLPQASTPSLNRQSVRMGLTRTIVVAAALTLPLAGHAQSVYRCGSAYSDKPCRGGQALQIDTLPSTPETEAQAESSREYWRQMRRDVDRRELLRERDEALSHRGTAAVAGSPDRSVSTRSLDADRRHFQAGAIGGSDGYGGHGGFGGNGGDEGYAGNDGYVDSDGYGGSRYGDHGDYRGDWVQGGIWVPYGLSSPHPHYSGLRAGSSQPWFPYPAAPPAPRPIVTPRARTPNPPGSPCAYGPCTGAARAR